MKLKIIIAASSFLIATPILIGQTLPGLPSAPAMPSVGTSSIPSLNSLPNSTLSNPLSGDALRQSGLDTNTSSQNPSDRARELRDQYKQGLLDESRLPSLPDNSSQLESIAKRFAEQTFPQEFQAAKGMLALPQVAPSSFPSALPTGIPSPTFIPSSLPSPPPSPSIPSL